MIVYFIIIALSCVFNFFLVIFWSNVYDIIKKFDNNLFFNFSFYETPDYEKIYNQIQCVYERLRLDMLEPYDWQVKKRKILKFI